MNARSNLQNLSRLLAVGALIAGCSVWSGCATGAGDTISMPAVEANSPTAVAMSPREAIRQAQAYVATHPDSDYAVGMGNSMLPLYHEHTVIVTQRLAMADLKPGMTVMFVNSEGTPVAHVLVRNTSSGWVTMGVGNPAPDDGRMEEGNYLGVVVKAFAATASPIVALDAPGPSGSLLVSNNP